MLTAKINYKNLIENIYQQISNKCQNISSFDRIPSVFKQNGSAKEEWVTYDTYGNRYLNTLTLYTTSNYTYQMTSSQVLTDLNNYFAALNFSLVSTTQIIKPIEMSRFLTALSWFCANKIAIITSQNYEEIRYLVYLNTPITDFVNTKPTNTFDETAFKAVIQDYKTTYSGKFDDNVLSVVGESDVNAINFITYSIINNSVNSRVIQFNPKITTERDPSYFTPVRFDYVGENLQSFTVPSGVKAINVNCVGARGYECLNYETSTLLANGGKGGSIICNMTVTEGEKLYIYVGGIPDYGVLNYNASDVRTLNGSILDERQLKSRLLVAGGGGSAGNYSVTITNKKLYAITDGASGGTYYANTADTAKYSTYVDAEGGTGATLEEAGVTGGSFGLGGYGNDGRGNGGAGWYGGGAGKFKSKVKSGKTYYACAGGGGGSSYANIDRCSSIDQKKGINDGNGYVIISPVTSS